MIDFLKKITLNKLKVSFYTFYYSLLNQDTKYPKYLTKFENDISKYFNKKFAITFSNGTTACKAALYSIGLKKDSKILLSRITFPSIISAILLTGCKPIFMSFDKNLQFILPDRETILSCNYFLITHAYGYPVDREIVEKIKEINPKIKIIEDISHSQGAKSGNTQVGSLGDVAFMSMQGNKAISAGEGGLVLTDSAKIKEKITYLSHLNKKNPIDEKLENLTKIGFIGKGRMNPLGAIKASYKLKELDERNKKIRNKFKIIYNHLHNNKSIKLPNVVDFDNLGGFFYGLPFFVESEKILKKLSKNFVISKYDWLALDLSENFNNPEKFLNLIYSTHIELEELLTKPNDDRRYLYFFSLEHLINTSEKDINDKMQKFFNDL